MRKIVKAIPKSTGRFIKRRRFLKFKPVAIAFTGVEPFDLRGERS